MGEIFDRTSSKHNGVKWKVEKLEHICWRKSDKTKNSNPNQDSA